MPKLEVRRADEVPSPSRASRAVQEQQRAYEQFIRDAEGNVGELVPDAGEQTRSIKVRLRRAATRLDAELEIWDVEGRVYFRRQTQRRRGRPPKTAS